MIIKLQFKWSFLLRVKKLREEKLGRRDKGSMINWYIQMCLDYKYRCMYTVHCTVI